MDSSTKKRKIPKSDLQLNRFHLIFLGILILVNIVLFIINTPPENNPLRKLGFQPEPTATSETIPTDEDISVQKNTLAAPTSTPTLRSTPTKTLFSTQTVIPTQTPIPTPHYLGPVSSYLPSLDMLPPNFYSNNLSVKIVNYQGQDNFNDSSMSVFQNDKPLNNLTDHVYIVSYHAFLFDDPVQALDFYEINSTQEGLNEYWKWLSDQNVIVRSFQYENNEKDGVKTTEYIVQIPGVQGYNIGVFIAFQTENLVYVLTCVSSQTSENSVNVANSEASQFLELAQEMTVKE